MTLNACVCELLSPLLLNVSSHTHSSWPTRMKYEGYVTEETGGPAADVRMGEKERKRPRWKMTFEKHPVTESRKRRPRLLLVCSKHGVFRQRQRLIPPPDPPLHPVSRKMSGPAKHARYYKLGHAFLSTIP